MPSTFIALEPDKFSKLLITSYARSLGFTSLIPDKDLHCTVMYSKMYVQRPYPLIKDEFFETAKTYQICYIGKAIALLLISKFLRERNTMAVACGLRSNFLGITPHLSIVYDPPPGLNLALLPQPDFEVNFVKEIMVVKDD